MAFDAVLIKLMQRYWRLTRGLTFGAQGAVIDGDGRFLLVRSSYVPGWQFPGGGVEKGEAAITTLLRELEEEVGVVPTEPPVLFGLYTNFAYFPNDHIALFLVRHWRQPKPPAPSIEILEHRFFPADDPPASTTSGTRRRIAEIVSGVPQGREW